MSSKNNINLFKNNKPKIYCKYLIAEFKFILNVNFSI